MRRRGELERGTFSGVEHGQQQRLRLRRRRDRWQRISGGTAFDTVSAA